MSHENIHEHLPGTVKNIGDAVSAATVLATLADWLPPLAALATLVWTCLRIADWWDERKERKRLRKEKSND